MNTDHSKKTYFPIGFCTRDSISVGFFSVERVFRTTKLFYEFRELRKYTSWSKISTRSYETNERNFMANSSVRKFTKF